MDLASRVRDRKVVQWALGYLAGAFVVWQGIDILGHQFALPIGLERAVTVLLAAGCIAAVVIAWFHGDRGAQRVPAIEILLLLFLTIATGGALWLVRQSTVRQQLLAATPVAAGVAEKPPSNGPNIAVLRFEDRNGDGPTDRLADAIHDQILNHLTHVTGFNPVARTSVVALQGKQLTINQIADTLNVRYVVEGSVEHDERGVKVVMQLIDPQSNDGHLRGEDTVFTDTDRFDLEDKVADWVVGQLVTALGTRADVTAHSRPNVSAAYDAYLKGRSRASERTREALTAAIDNLEQSVRLDSTYGPANTALAFAYGLWGTYGYGGPNASYRAYGRAVHLADRGVRMDPTNGDAHATRSYLLNKAFAPDADVEPGFRKALEFLPSSADVHALYANFLSRAGRFDEAVREARHAVTLDPVAAGREAGLGWYLLAAGDPASAYEASQHANVLEPELMSPRIIRAYSLVLLNRAQECAAIDLGAFDFVRAVCLHAAGQSAAARALVDAGMKKNAAGSPAAQLAGYYAFTGDADRALRELERTFAETPFGLDFRLIDSGVFAPVRNNARFQRGWNAVRKDVWRQVQRAAAAAR